MKRMLVLVLVLALAACTSVTIRTDSAGKTKVPPDFQQTYVYWWWGLKGEHSVNVREVCQGRAVEQMQSVSTLSNLFFTIITFGIREERSARVWCKGAKNE
ncbi:Bor protein [Oceanospirillum multiglobuliferum]|uniref:Bor family protein n=1 Tax=Oceanospirillum multiglobuliferum TaxID=64969 RepID=A0A1T4PES0_9GAMM|nr:hypothetical protein [Oceanospirillum multiglobuliferum]OPX55586.1 hypothetical protein BTE48_08195 [Oceanospirillum multiglobuliferum]SJZ89827.1 Bor protein [Oceanospirillum multiglobuliferum]